MNMTQLSVYERKMALRLLRRIASGEHVRYLSESVTGDCTDDIWEMRLYVGGQKATKEQDLAVSDLTVLGMVECDESDEDIQPLRLTEYGERFLRELQELSHGQV